MPDNCTKQIHDNCIEQIMLVSQAAEALGLTPAAIDCAIKEGRLKAYKLGKGKGVYVIFKDCITQSVTNGLLRAKKDIINL